MASYLSLMKDFCMMLEMKSYFRAELVQLTVS